MYILCFTCTCFNNTIIAAADRWCRTVGAYDCSAGRQRKNPREKKKTFKGKRNHLDPCHGRCILSPAKPIGCGEKLSMSRWMSARMQLPFHRALNTSSGVEYNLSLDIPVLSTPSWHTGRVIQKPYAEKYPCGNLWNFTNLPSSTRV